MGYKNRAIPLRFDVRDEIIGRAWSLHCPEIIDGQA